MSVSPISTLTKHQLSAVEYLIKLNMANFFIFISDKSKKFRIFAVTLCVADVCVGKV